MRMRRVVSLLVFIGLLLGLGLGQGLAQGRDPNLIPRTIDSAVTLSLLPVIKDSAGSDTVLILYSTQSGLSSTAPARIGVEIYDTKGAGPSLTFTVTLTGANSLKSTLVGNNAVTADGIAVIRRVTEAGADTTGFYGGSALYLDSTLGAGYERPLVMLGATARVMPGFNDVHQGYYQTTGTGIRTKFHIICPGSSSLTTNTDTSFLNRLKDFGLLFRHLLADNNVVTEHLDVSVFNEAGTLQPQTFPSCRQKTFQNLEAKDLSSAFTSGGSGLYQITAATAETHSSTETRGDVLVWRILTSGTFGFDARSNIRDIEE